MLKVVLFVVICLLVARLAQAQRRNIMAPQTPACESCGETTEPDFYGGFRPIKLQDGVCFTCWRYQEGITLDFRSPLQKHLDELADDDGGNHG